MKVVVSHWMHGNPEFDLIKFKIPYEEHQRSIIIKIRDIEDCYESDTVSIETLIKHFDIMVYEDSGTNYIYLDNKGKRFHQR